MLIVFTDYLTTHCNVANDYTNQVFWHIAISCGMLPARQVLVPSSLAHSNTLVELNKQLLVNKFMPIAVLLLWQQ